MRIAWHEGREQVGSQPVAQAEQVLVVEVARVFGQQCFVALDRFVDVLANLAIDQNDEAALRENIDEAIKRYEELLTENPRDLDDQYLLSLCYRLRADLFAALVPADPQFLPAAIDDYSKASRIVQKLNDLNPSVRRYHEELVRLLVNLGQLFAQQQDFDQARAQFQSARTLIDEWARSSKENDSSSANLRSLIEAAMSKLPAAKKPNE